MYEKIILIKLKLTAMRTKMTPLSEIEIDEIERVYGNFDILFYGENRQRFEAFKKDWTYANRPYFHSQKLESKIKPEKNSENKR